MAVSRLNRALQFTMPERTYNIIRNYSKIMGKSSSKLVLELVQMGIDGLLTPEEKKIYSLTNLIKDKSEK